MGTLEQPTASITPTMFTVIIKAMLTGSMKNHPLREVKQRF
jgi:hypothetical protein